MTKTDPTQFSNFRLDWSPLRRVRRSLDLSQTDLARYVGVHRETIGRIERGVMDPSYRTVLAIARAMGKRRLEIYPDEEPRAIDLLIQDTHNIIEPRA